MGWRRITSRLVLENAAELQARQSILCHIHVPFFSPIRINRLAKVFSELVEMDTLVSQSEW